MASFQISLEKLRANAQVLHDMAEKAACHIVLALKGFSTWRSFESFRDLLEGCCASGLWEAELAARHFGKAILVYSPIYKEAEMPRLLEIAHHLDFNSFGQWERFKKEVCAHPRYLSGELTCGLRVNPECSTGNTPLYDPCSLGSRLGIIRERFEGQDITGISGLHFHTLCEQDSPDLEKTLAALEEKFGDILARPEIKWLNMGGGHWITKPFYDRERLIELIRRIKERYQVEVWLEPGEALAIHSGVLRAQVEDVFPTSGGVNIALLDVSASAHTPDVLEMPYRPDLFLVEKEESAQKQKSVPHPYPALVHLGESYVLAGDAGELAHTYRLGAPTCLAGDIFGDYSFPRALKVGDILVFDDMAHYTLVKTTMFNGVVHPSVELVDAEGKKECVRSFSYEDFEARL